MVSKALTYLCFLEHKLVIDHARKKYHRQDEVLSMLGLGKMRSSEVSMHI